MSTESREERDNKILSTIVTFIIIVFGLPFLSYHMNNIEVFDGEVLYIHNAHTQPETIDSTVLFLEKADGSQYEILYDYSMKTRFLPPLDPQLMNTYPAGLPSWMVYEEFRDGNIAYRIGQGDRPLVSKKAGGSVYPEGYITFNGFLIYTRMFWTPVFKYQAFFNNQLILHFF